MKIKTLKRTTASLHPFGFSSSSMIGRYLYTDSQGELPPHHHQECLEICYLVSGDQVYHINNQYYSVRGGDFFITFPNEIHSTGGYLQTKGFLYWLIIGPPLSPRLRKKLSTHFNPLFKKVLQIPRRHFSPSTPLDHLFKNLLLLAQSPLTPLNKIRTQHQIDSILLKIVDHAEAPFLRKISPSIQHVLDLIHKQEQKISLASLQKVTGLSVSRLILRFKKEVGTSPHDYIEKVLLQRAIEKLQKPGATVTEVAFDLGFSTSQYFATFIKKRTRKNPKEFLKK